MNEGLRVSIHISYISPGFYERSSETAMGGGDVQRPSFHVNVPEKTGARSAAKTPSSIFLLYSFRFTGYFREKKKIFFPEKNRWTEAGKEPHARAILLIFPLYNMYFLMMRRGK